MADGGSHENEPFYFSDSIGDIDEEAPYIRLQLFQELKCPAAVLCVDAISGETLICAGYVKKTGYNVLDMETHEGRQVRINIVNAGFYPLKRKDASGTQSCNGRRVYYRNALPYGQIRWLSASPMRHSGGEVVRAAAARPRRNERRP